MLVRRIRECPEFLLSPLRQSIVTSDLLGRDRVIVKPINTLIQGVSTQTLSLNAQCDGKCGLGSLERTPRVGMAEDAPLGFLDYDLSRFTPSFSARNDRVAEGHFARRTA